MRVNNILHSFYSGRLQGQQQIQGCDVLCYAWQDKHEQCETLKTYFKDLAKRHKQEAKALAQLAD